MVELSSYQSTLFNKVKLSIFLTNFIKAFTEATVCRFSKQVFLKISQNSQKIHLCWSIFLIKFQAWRTAILLKRDSNAGVFLRILRIFNNSFFYRTPQVGAFAFTANQMLIFFKHPDGVFLLWKHALIRIKIFSLNEFVEKSWTKISKNFETYFKVKFLHFSVT